jgi:hypothetical protein
MHRWADTIGETKPVMAEGHRSSKLKLDGWRGQADWQTQTAGYALSASPDDRQATKCSLAADS